MTGTQHPSTQAAATPPALLAWLREALPSAGHSVPSNLHQQSLQPLRAEASFRQFYRVKTSQGSLVVMASPPEKENNRQFVRMAKALGDAGVRVPEVLVQHSSQGYMLLSDLGTDHLIDAYRRGNARSAVQAALATLPLIQGLRADFIPTYTQSRFSDELNIFVDWLVVAGCDTPLPTSLFEAARTLLLANAQDQPTLCVHRDYHCRNLLLQQDGSVGVLDFQDALMGPAYYDLASLLHDCYWELDTEIIDACAGSNRRQVDLLAVQRQLKALGIFARLYLRDGKANHLRYILPVLRRLTHLCACSHELQPLRVWLAESLLPRCTHWIGSQASSAHEAQNQ